MNIRSALLAAGFLSFCLASALADGKISVNATEGTDDGMKIRSIHFASECGDECQVASLSCGGAPRLEVELSDITSKDAAKSITREQSLLVLAVGGQSQEMPVTSFTFSEMNGSWDVAAYGPDPDAVFKAFGKAKTFTLTLESRSEKLPVTKDVLAWAKACLE